jgi:Domain of unknown function (DUF1858)
MSLREAVDGVTEKPRIPDLVRTAPHARPVLDRYGLRGCGRFVTPIQGPPAEAELLTPKHLIGEVLDRHPKLLPTFAAFGFRPLLNPVLQLTLTRRVTLGQACRVAGVDSESLLTALNGQLTHEADGGGPTAVRRAPSQ